MKRRAEELLAVKGYDTRGATLACYGAGGFEDDLRSAAACGDVSLFDVADLY